MFAFSSTDRIEERSAEEFIAGRQQTLHFIFVEQARRPCSIVAITKGTVHADIITDIEDHYAPIIFFLS
jgi:hypothetical protein